MAYLLVGREQADATRGTLRRPCIFCGGWVDRRTGKRVHVLGAHRTRAFGVYFHCGDCPQELADAKFERSIWRCPCAEVDCIGEQCATCRTPREEALRDDLVWVTNARLIFRVKPPLGAMLKLEAEICKRYAFGEGLVIDAVSVACPAKAVGLEDE